MTAILANIAVSVALILVFKAVRAPAAAGQTLPRDYRADRVEVPAAIPAG